MESEFDNQPAKEKPLLKDTFEEIHIKLGTLAKKGEPVLAKDTPQLSWEGIHGTPPESPIASSYEETVFDEKGHKVHVEAYLYSPDAPKGLRKDEIGEFFVITESPPFVKDDPDSAMVAQHFALTTDHQIRYEISAADEGNGPNTNSVYHAVREWGVPLDPFVDPFSAMGVNKGTLTEDQAQAFIKRFDTFVAAVQPQQKET